MAKRQREHGKSSKKRSEAVERPLDESDAQIARYLARGHRHAYYATQNPVEWEPLVLLDEDGRVLVRERPPRWFRKLVRAVRASGTPVPESPRRATPVRSPRRSARKRSTGKSPPSDADPHPLGVPKARESLSADCEDDPPGVLDDWLRSLFEPGLVFLNVIDESRSADGGQT